MNCVKGLLAYFEELDKDFHRYFTEVLRSAEEEAVHQFRVNMKKQVAFFNLLEHLDEYFFAQRALEAYGKLYKKAGKARNFQVEKKVIQGEENRHELDHAFSQWLDEQERERCRRLQEYAEGFSLVPVRRLGQLVRSHISYLPVDQLRQRFLHYFSQLFTGVRALLEVEKRREENFHALRKLVKELFFNLRLVDSMLTRRRIPKKMLQQCDDAQQLLGKWHDYYFTLDRLGKGQDKCPPELIRYLEEERGVHAMQITNGLDALSRLIDTLDEKMKDLLEKEPFAKPPSGRSKRKKTAAHPSFEQVNVGEGNL